LTLLSVLGLSSQLRFIRGQRIEFWNRVSGEMAALQLELKALEAAVLLNDPVLSQKLLFLLENGKNIDHLEPYLYGKHIRIHN
jgi:hypothetical protein